MKKHKIYCVPKDGKFHWEDKIQLANLPGKLSKYGRVQVEFSKYVPRKSLPQLGYYFGGVLVFLEKETFDDYGLNKDEWHQFFKGKFGERKYDTKTGSIEIIRSISTYTEKEMSHYLKLIIEWLYHDLNLTVPPANKIKEYV